MERRYQVFVSSTYIDLVEARNEVMQALLELDCMPAGMELFPAANDDQWSWIKKVIDESDYYIVVVGGRYGSVSDNTGLSYTEMEYRYAVEQKKPVIGFLHDDPSQIPAKASEQDPKMRQKLERFRSLVKSRLCKFWSTPSDLGAKVSRSITQLFKQYPAVGWIRADQIPTLHTSDEVLRLRQRIDSLEQDLAKHEQQNRIDQSELASGGDQYQLKFRFKRKEQNEKDGRKSWVAVGQAWSEVAVSWDQIFSFIAPDMINGISEWDFSRKLNLLASTTGRPVIESRYPGQRFEEITISDENRRAITVHLRALGLIELSDDSRWWFLTDEGDRYMTKLLAVPKSAKAKPKERKAK